MKASGTELPKSTRNKKNIMEITFQLNAEALINGDKIERTHDVQGTGVTLNACRRQALDELAESFPTDGGKHSFTGIKRVS